MAIPNFQEFMLPVLELHSDGGEHSSPECVSHCENVFNLTEEERATLLPSGKKRTSYDRTNWAITYLKQAGLLITVKRGVYSISSNGLELIAKKPQNITVKLLQTYSAFMESRVNNKKIVLETTEAYENRQSPEEIIDENYLIIKTKICDELLELILRNSPEYFEKLVIDVLVNMGYGGSRSEAGRAVGKSGDEGIDGVINEDRLGLDTIYIQAKRWDKHNTIGRPEIQKFVGALAGKQATKGIFITTSSFSSEAKLYVKNLVQKVILIDGFDLTSYMVEYNVGVAIDNTYVIKKIDYDYFDEV